MGKFFDCEPLWGSWYLEEEIGSGSFGHVYKAVHTEFGKSYYSAVKHIGIPADSAQLRNASAITSDVKGYFDSFAKDIRKEIDVMYSLRGHTNIVNYEDCQFIPKDDGIGYDVFIRMELLTGIDRLGRLTRGQIIKLGTDICSALEVCEKKKIIHRDIKPQNIFVNENGDFKLGDFGIARAMERTVGSISMSFAGTPAYMAPEIYNHQHAGHPADIYSLGIVLYQLLNDNRLPLVRKINSNDAGAVRQEYEMAKVRRLSGETLPPPSRADKPLAQVVLKACAYDPGSRYQSASQLKAALQRLMTDDDMASTVPGAWTRTPSENMKKTEPPKRRKSGTGAAEPPARRREEVYVPEYGRARAVPISGGTNISNRKDVIRKINLAAWPVLIVLGIVTLVKAAGFVFEDEQPALFTAVLLLFALICQLLVRSLKRKEYRGSGNKFLAGLFTTLAVIAPALLFLILCLVRPDWYENEEILNACVPAYVSIAMIEFFARNEADAVRRSVPTGAAAVLWGIIGLLQMLPLFIFLFLPEQDEGFLGLVWLFIPASVCYLCYRSYMSKKKAVTGGFVIAILLTAVMAVLAIIMAKNI